MNSRKTLVGTAIVLVVASMYRSHVSAQDPPPAVRFVGVEYAFILEPGKFIWDVSAGRWRADEGQGGLKVGSVTMTFAVRSRRAEFVLFVDQLENRHGVTFFKGDTGDDLYFLGNVGGNGARQLSPDASANPLATLFYTDKTTISTGALVPIVGQTGSAANEPTLSELATKIESIASNGGRWRSNVTPDAVRAAVAFWKARVAQDLAPLFKPLRDGSNDQKLAAIRVMSHVYHHSVLTELERAIGDLDPGVSAAAKGAAVLVSSHLRK